MLNHTIVLVIFAVTLCTISTAAAASDAKFGPSNPFYAPSPLPFQAPPFDRIKDADYQPAIEAGIAEERSGSTGDREQPGGADLRKHAGRHGEDRATAIEPRPLSARSAGPIPIPSCKTCAPRWPQSWLPTPMRFT